MRSIESVGKTVEDAIANALERLKVERDQVVVEVIDEGAKGIFGLLGSKLARVKVTLKTTAPTSPIVVEPKSTDKEHAQPGNTDVAKAEWGKLFLRELLVRMGVQGEVKVSEIGEVIMLSITGDNMGLIIGHRGQTLDSVQYLVNLAGSKAFTEGSKFVVDAENYRIRRQKTLEQLAQRLADKVVTRRQKAILDPMPPQERRIVHLFLRDNPDVCTYSEGNEPYRRVVIDVKK